jgi:AcrR family transcriptional regulator
MSTVEAPAATRGRGRPRTFDEEAVLDTLTSLFWAQGYGSTSVADIAEAAQLNKSSLYNAFGSKQELFNRILDRYISARTEMLGGLIAQTGSGIGALHAFLEMVRSETTLEMGHCGCLAVNTSAELGGESPEMVAFAERYRDRITDALRSMIQRVADAGDVDAGQVENHTNMLMMVIMGISLTARSGAGAAEIGRLVDAAHANVDTWFTGG